MPPKLQYAEHFHKGQLVLYYVSSGTYLPSCVRSQIAKSSARLLAKSSSLGRDTQMGHKLPRSDIAISHTILLDTRPIESVRLHAAGLATTNDHVRHTMMQTPSIRLISHVCARRDSLSKIRFA